MPLATVSGHATFAALGLGAAVVQIVTGISVEGVAIVVVAATLCYLAAAAFDHPWVAWVSILGATAVVFVSELVGVPWWAGAGIVGVVLFGIGVSRGASARTVPQMLAFLAFGGLAVVGAHLAPRVGLAIAGAALAAHAGWDVAHWRRHVVVPRSLAEFCVFLDIPLGAAAILVALEG